MKVEQLIKIIDSDFYTGVPDSLLKPLCNYLMDTYGIDPKHHIVAANEGNCTAIAAGYYLATEKIPVVYMQNSGEGNIINPVASLLNDQVYAIPVIFIIGWRGEPGVKDEPQHIYQGEITLQLLDDMGMPYYVLDRSSTEADLQLKMKEYRQYLSNGKSIALVVKKSALEYEKTISYHNQYDMKREEVIRHIVKYAGDDIIISTTGKASRELFEIRESNNQTHDNDFLTVGSMGHASSIAFGIAINKPSSKIWCIDGDGSLLMHMGSMAVIGAYKPDNIIHVVINNSAHETVGGVPTVASDINISGIAEACGYSYVQSVESYDLLDKVLEKTKQATGPVFIEARCALGARSDLGRPTSTPKENKLLLMERLKKI